jgi:hypothetical protein
MKKILVIIVMLLLVGGGVKMYTTYFASAERATSARELFALYVKYGEMYDSRIADLYTDDAVIKNTRRYANGQIEKIEFSGRQYKALIRAAMDTAKQQGDHSTFSKVSYTPVGDGVRIKATRYSELKRYTSPISWLVAPDANGNWQIHEEISESRS